MGEIRNIYRLTLDSSRRIEKLTTRQWVAIGEIKTSIKSFIEIREVLSSYSYVGEIKT
jgi:hypothetical protein